MKKHWFLYVFRYPASCVILGYPGVKLRLLSLPNQPKRAQAPPQMRPEPPKTAPRPPKMLPEAPQELLTARLMLPKP